MSGHVGDLSPAQEEALRKLKASLSDVTLPENDDYFFLRWLRAVKFDVHKAEDRLRKHVEFRREYGVDTILTDWSPPEVLVKYFPTGFFGEDRDGHPVYYDNLGNLDPKGLHRSCRQEDIVKLKVMHAEMFAAKTREFTEKKGRKIETITSVIDMENLSFHRHYYWPGINLFTEMSGVFQHHYPERSHRILAVKAPRIFPALYNVVKRFIDENTKSKIVVLGANWKEELLQYISPDQLPQAYGGTRCEPDPMCTNFITVGGDIPPEYYLTNLTETSKEDMESVLVSRGSSYEREFTVELPGTVIRWEFITNDHDISFGWYQKSGAKRRRFLPPTTEMSEVVPMKRRNSHIVPESGVLLCSTAGIYVMKFDNSYSWTRSKEVFYSIKLLPPDTELSVPQMAAEEDGTGEEEEFYECGDGPEDRTVQNGDPSPVGDPNPMS
ncbi:hypothetical protein EMCRGX_G025029 [Ephydatia muelleri]|eukprot:Em0015g1174a